MDTLHITMFGDFSIQMNQNIISNTDNRSKKVWSLLAYLIYHRERTIKQSELIDILWSDSEKSTNPFGALKTLLYRTRVELDKLYDGAGHQLILCNGDGYSWNKEVPITLDYDFFEKINTTFYDLERSIHLLKLYKGDFLARLSSELWVLPISTHFHNSFIHHLQTLVPQMLEQGRFSEAIQFCQTAANIEPYNEDIHALYMQSYIASGNPKKAIDIYHKLSVSLLSDLGVIPSESTRHIYREAMKTTNSRALSISELQGQLKENTTARGALVCDYDFFLILYHSMARSIMRSGIAVHIALISAVDRDGNELKSKKLEKIMPNLEDVLRSSLRRGDSVAKCSSSQYVIMLPRANYENSCMVCERIQKVYYQKHNRTDVILRYEICPLIPDQFETYQFIK